MDGASNGAKEGPHIMRQQYTCIFKRTLSSRVWALTPAQRVVWLWLKLSADPEGFVCSDLTGVALGARVTGAEAREALEVLAMPDADADPEDPHEGRIVERVRGGWRLLGYESDIELVKRETRRARTRQYMRNARSRAANDVTPCDPETVTVTPSKSTSRSNIPPSEGRDSPLPPAGDSCDPIELSDGSLHTKAELMAFADEVDAAPPTEKAPPSRDVAPQSTDTLPVVLRRIPDDWTLSEALRAEAVMAGVTDLDARIETLRAGPIGGSRGIFPDKLDDYIRSSFGKWKTWAETDRAKARAAAAAPPSSRRQFIPPTPEPKPKHVNYAKAHGIDLKAVVADLAERKVFETLGEQSYFTNLERALAKERKRKSGEAA